MAKKDDKSITPNIGRIDKTLNNLSNSVEKLYQTTYKSRMDNEKELNNIINSIDDNMNSILSKINGQSVSDISNLYMRLQRKNDTNGKEVSSQLEEIFGDGGTQSLFDTINVDNIRRTIQTQNYQYDIICRYMSKLEDALDIKKDNVLSSDNFTKEFINIVSNRTNKKSSDEFFDKASVVKEKYKVQSLFEEMYYKTSKYGEYFLYRVPYKKAFEILLKRKHTMSNNGIRFESSIQSSNDIIFESSMIENDNILQELDQKYKDAIIEGNMEVQISFDTSGIISGPIESAFNAYCVKRNLNLKSICESYEKNGTPIYESELKFEDDSDKFSSEGLINSKSTKEEIQDITGTVLYEIPRDEIFPINIYDECVGYINLDVQNSYVSNMSINGYSYNSLTNNTKLMADEFDKQNDLLIAHIASKMSEQIDAKFINNNIDLKEQIYSILRYNDKFCCTNGTNNINVRFIPAEDIHHFYFKLDKNTHRGISDLDKAIVPAMLYCLLYLNTVIGQMNRSQDKRVYYVKQNVETNVAKTLLNVITQIKKGNMGMRQLENMNTIFNIVGKFNDHVIPVGQSGESPIQMEVLQGQQIDTPTELLDRFEDAAINTTDVPLEFLQSVNSVDYATRFTMSNSKFLRKVYSRQRICQEHFTSIFRKLYNYEYEENDQTMKILLPAPAFLAMTNSQQLVENVKTYANSIAEITCANESEEVKARFINLCCRNFLGTYIDFSMIDNMIETAKHDVSIDTDDSSGSDDSYED